MTKTKSAMDNSEVINIAAEPSIKRSVRKNVLWHKRESNETHSS